MSEKNGGPYTKAEQEKRRKQVYEMHFEKSQSASSIAEELDVNRNTINEDIKYWYSEMASEFEQLDVKNLMLKQHARFELQRTRLMETLEKEQNIINIMKLERLIFDIDCTIMKMIAPIAAMQAQDIPEQIATQTVEHLLSGDVRKITSYSETILLRDIIEYKKCDIAYAQRILDKIRALGLELFKSYEHSPETRSYDMLGFAESRKILSDEKLKEIYSKMDQNEKEQDKQIEELNLEVNEIEKRFLEKYGNKSGWPAAVWKSYYAKIGLLR